MKKLSLESCLKRFKAIHGTKYNYDKVKYFGANVKVEIECKIHGIFLQEPHSHWLGQGCPKCTKTFKRTNETFIKESKKIHKNKFDYSMVDYKNNKTKVKIICLNCNKVFEQRPNDHLSGNGCYSCSNIKRSNTKKFIKKAKQIHGERYDYSITKYQNNNKTKVKIICLNCNKVFEQRPNDHLTGLGCPNCVKSKNEILIEKFLTINNIEFIPQKNFKDCRNKLPLPFDFYLPEYNICIEYDGEQHFKPVQFGGMTTQQANQSFKEIVFKDRIKTKYCEQKEIKLIRISYKDNIENILIKEFKING
ncbi:MAG: hypothetical protein ACOC56_05270 [Atribacterota bacterium]